MKFHENKFIAMLVILLGWNGLCRHAVHAEGETTPTPAQEKSEPWEKFSFSFGAFLSKSNTTARVGGGLGVDLDLEKLTGLDSTSTVFRVDSGWRFTNNRRHRWDASWFSVHRSAEKQVGEDFDVTKPDGSVVTVAAGTDVSSHFNLDIIQTGYSYSFFQDDRADLAVGGGFYVLPINFGLSASDIGQTDVSLKFTAPLPVLSLRMDFLLTPKWYIRTGSQVFYVEYQGFKGRLTEMRGAVEYLPFKHFGFGLGYDSFLASFEAKGNDYPNVDLSGSVKFQYTGLQLYGKYFF